MNFRVIIQPSTSAGFTFSAPYLHTGLGFAGQPQYVTCAEALRTSGTICANLTICVQDTAAYTDIVNNLFPNFAGLKLAPQPSGIYYEFRNNICNVLAGKGSDLIESSVMQIGYNGSYQVGLNQYSKQPLSLVTRDDDVEWSDLVNWVLLGLLSAETRHVTQGIAKNAIKDPTQLGDEIMFYDAVATVGNYGEIYERNLQSLLPRAYVNMLNNGSSPLISSIPFGDVTVDGPGPTSGGTLEQIAQRGVLRCGVAEDAFFSNFNNQQWSGLDIDFCRAVAAALFGPSSNPEFVNVTASGRFQELANGTIDVISRTASETYERNVDEPTTGEGFFFTQPYFYTGVQFGGIPQ